MKRGDGGLILLATCGFALSACTSLQPIVTAESVELAAASVAEASLVEHSAGISRAATSIAAQARNESPPPLASSLAPEVEISTARAASSFTRSHPAIDHYIEYYSDRAPAIITSSLERASLYFPMIREIFAGTGIPTEVAYLPIVESHFKNDADSRAGAAGMWQFIPGTGKHYGLRIDRCVDERRDPASATRAAARYLRALHDRFDDWHLALAAYNAGEGRIEKIMEEHQVDDYWTMVDRRLLPRETRRYVPRFLAIVTIMDNADVFGFALPDPPLAITTTRVDRPISLETVARLAGVERSTVEDLNPALGCKRVPRGGFDVHLPVHTMDDFESAYASLGNAPYLDGDGTHRVRRGESPISIARRYGVSVRALMEENDISNPRRLRANTTLRIPDPI